MKITALWKKLLQLEKKIRIFSEKLNFVYLSDQEILINELPVSYDAGSWLITLDQSIDLPDDIIVFQSLDLLKIDCKNADSLSADALQFIQIYLPYCFLTHHAIWIMHIGCEHSAKVSSSGRIP